MAEQTFRSPGFFEQEIDLSARVQAPVGIPAGVIGTAQKGPAFVPVTVGSIADFQTKFGSLDQHLFGPYAVNEWLKNRTALTYLRVLGAGANASTTDISTTKIQGTVKNAGFVVSGSRMNAAQAQAGMALGDVGAVQFLIAKHDTNTDEDNGYPLFTDNSSITTSTAPLLVRGMLFTTTGSRAMVMSNDQFYSDLGADNAIKTGYVASVGAIASSALSATKYFKIILSSTLPTFGTAEGKTGLRILSASLDPNDGAYIGKILNTDPMKFGEEQHLLYADFSVEHDLAPVKSGVGMVAIVSGSQNGSTVSGAGTSLKFAEMFGRFDTRYTTARTTSFISQPYGRKEYDLFHFETLDDGESGNNSYKVSIANLRASTNPADPYGTFEVQVRSLGDLDTVPQVLESYPQCSLNPLSDRYVARLIGDKKAYFDFDQDNPDERRLIVSGKYPNVSQRIRIVMNNDVEINEVPSDALPFGFRGIPTLKTTDSLKDNTTKALVGKDGRVLGDVAARRFTSPWGSSIDTQLGHVSAIVPPLPFRVKVTKGATKGASFLGEPGVNERVQSNYYWGVNTVRIPVSSSNSPSGIPDAVLRANEGSDFNTLITAYNKFIGIQKMDSLVTGSGADEFNDNKFTLARVATSQTGAGLANVFATNVFTGSADQIMLETAYIRNGNPDTSDYTIDDGYNNRYTLASLIATSSVVFNRFTPYAKFTNIFYGGFDGLDITDKDRFYFRDRALSSDAGGKAASAYLGPLDVGSTRAGAGRLNNNVASMNAAVGIMTDPFSTNINLLAIPGVREPFVADNALVQCRDNGLIMYVMDMPKYDSNGNRLYDDSPARPDPGKTSEQLETRAIDNSYGAVFFPDVSIEDNRRRIKVPASVAMMHVLAFNDKVAFPWFAPAGFNRGAMDFVMNVETRLSQADKDTLYDARINPIATFPNGGFVVFGQKTLQQAKSALDRINVRRLMLELKRIIGGIAQQLLFEPNNGQTRARFVASVTPQLALIQAQQGIESFKVVCDDTNNTSSDAEANKLNGRIIVVPTRTIEFVSIDFIITNSGVQFL